MRKLLESLCGLLAAAALFAIMVLTLIDVTGRKLISTSVPGSLEMTELLMVVVIFAGLPLVSLSGEHVVFDSLDPLIPPVIKRLQQALVELICAACLLGVGWLMWVKGNQMIEYGDISAQLKLTLGPFVWIMSALCAVTAIVHGMLVFSPVDHRHAGVDSAGTL